MAKAQRCFLFSVFCSTKKKCKMCIVILCFLHLCIIIGYGFSNLIDSEFSFSYHFFCAYDYKYEPLNLSSPPTIF